MINVKEQHPEERQMQEEAELTNYMLNKDQKLQEQYVEKLNEMDKRCDDVLAQIRLIQAICEDAIDNMNSIKRNNL